MLSAVPPARDGLDGSRERAERLMQDVVGRGENDDIGSDGD